MKWILVFVEKSDLPVEAHDRAPQTVRLGTEMNGRLEIEMEE